jgi:tRNA (adenine22-N1)-methyltransferase
VLSPRLTLVAEQIQSLTHVDIGSDHAHLLVSLLRSGKIERGIAIENKGAPLRRSKDALVGLNAEVLLGDGLEPIGSRDIQSLSICGMGGEAMARILEAFPERVPPLVVLQPNRHAERLRRWAHHAGFHLAHEQILWSRWPCTVLCFKQSQSSLDPAYVGLAQDAAFLFGPLILKSKTPEFLSSLRTEQSQLQSFGSLCNDSQRRLSIISRVLETGE